MKFPSRRDCCLLAAAGLALAAGPGPTRACVEGDVRGEAVTVEKAVGTTASGEHADMQIHGAGWFRALAVEKQGGTSDQTSVTIELDGEPLISTSFAMLKNAWNQLNTNYIIAKVRTEGTRSIMTVWYSPELRFRALANLRVDVQEDGVDSIRVSAIMNKPAPHEHIPGQAGTPAALPAFK